MPREERLKIIDEIEKNRGRKLISLCNFDRLCIPEYISGISTTFGSDIKEPLYRILKETRNIKNGIDVFLYTRGGDTNSVWPIVCLLREFDPDFEVLVPYRAHSSGTMLALSAKKIVMCLIGELSPIDPTTGNHFNPVDPLIPGNRLGIGVEDVNAFEEFIKSKLKDNSANGNHDGIEQFILQLLKEVHPLAIGNVHRVHQQIRQLAEMLLECHPKSDRNNEKIISKLTTGYYSHLHMIGRHEAKDILGDQIEFASNETDSLLDKLLRAYENDFFLRTPFIALNTMADDSEKEVTFVGGIVESSDWGYKFQTKGKLYQFSRLPKGVQIQLPAGQNLPLIPGLPRDYRLDLISRRWVRNLQPEGVTK